MKIPVKPQMKLKDGVHNGIIEKIEYKEKPFEYTDIFIKESGTEIILKYGIPTIKTLIENSSSKMGKLLSKFIKYKIGDELDPEQILLGKQVTFMTITETVENEEGEDVEYARIVDNSIKPLVEEMRIKE